MPPPSDISDWEKSGLMTPEKIRQRLYDQIVSYCFDENEHAALREKFNSPVVGMNGIKHWDQAIFQNFLSELSIPSSLPLLTEAGPILFSSAVYMSRFPFNTQPIRDLPSNLTYEDLLRAIFWVLPERASVDRTRTASDQRRIIFQSLADISGDFGFDEEEEKKIAAQRAFQVVDHSRDWALSNYDEEGDEMYHDILDVISSSRMQFVEPSYSTYDRNDFRPLARRLATPTCLRQLAISRGRFKPLVKLLLAEHLNDGIQKPALQLAELEVAADHVVDTFCRGSGPDEVITWQKFEWALSERTPFLFFSLYRLYESLVRTSDDDSVNKYVAYPPQSVPSGHILNLVTISQILFTIDSTVAFDNPRLIYQYDDCQAASDVPTVSEVHDAIKFSPKESWDFRLLLVSGKSTSNGETVVFGAFLQGLGEEEKIIPRQEDHLEGSLLFQLAPIHDVFRSNIGKKAWTVGSDNELCFGEKGQGFSMRFVDGLKRLNVIHKVGVHEESIYQATEWRGSWEMEVEIDKVEVWE
ncbi:uncharacterized protein BP5553_08094 [Venustampulla echinocandica]|uniref:Uncharacterized protein n=1 Tax=Venustampulla echinocandica TaxID=2656787 RepID=A0A370TFQ6_9HELO|nr:uncharacterized protein BP5553_08094 [Venustampulla echinocandica]RDL33726.1 hypothetical protein BP5553_08094 [Venustampulla echinocandica]